jgi:hypothetical protein
MNASGTTIADLAVLGVVQRTSVQPDRIRSAVKGLFPDQWQPTAGVVDAAVERAVSAGHLSICHPGSQETTISTTDTGRAQFQALLLTDPGDALSPAVRTLEAMQFCFLDLADANTTRKVLNRIRRRTKQRLTALRQRTQKCPHAGRYASLWVSMETRRLETSAQLINLVCSDVEHEIQDAAATGAIS